jgi:hypothetical protein
MHELVQSDFFERLRSCSLPFIAEAGNEDERSLLLQLGQLEQLERGSAQQATQPAKHAGQEDVGAGSAGLQGEPPAAGAAGQQHVVQCAATRHLIWLEGASSLHLPELAIAQEATWRLLARLRGLRNLELHSLRPLLFEPCPAPGLTRLAATGCVDVVLLHRSTRGRKGPLAVLMPALRSLLCRCNPQHCTPGALVRGHPRLQELRVTFERQQQQQELEQQQQQQEEEQCTKECHLLATAPRLATVGAAHGARSQLASCAALQGLMLSVAADRAASRLRRWRSWQHWLEECPSTACAAWLCRCRWRVAGAAALVMA